MKDKHIIEILEQAPLQSLGREVLVTLQTHTKDCASCRRAYKAAQLSTLILKERVGVKVEPPPFFQTRVLAALRERSENVPVIWRLWKSAGLLVSSMAVTTAALAVLSFAVPTSVTTGNQETAALNSFSAEGIILGQKSDEQMTYEQVLSTIYADEDEAK